MSPRFTLVLGGGGSTGMAYMCGGLRALEDAAGLRADDADLIIGTSAGSVLAADIRRGKPLAEMLRSVDPTSEDRSEVVRAWRSIPDLTRRVVGSAWVASRTAFPVPIPAPEPPGFLQRMFPASLLTVAGDEPWAMRYPVEWPQKPMWITACNLDTKRRVVLSRTQRNPESTLRQALRASCAVPGVYSPIRVDNQRLVDGGVASVNNLDLAVRAPTDIVIALAPMGFDPRHPPGALRTLTRSRVNAVMAGEADRVRRAGKRLLLIRPTGSELEKHGFNFLSNRGNDVIEQAAYDATMSALTSDRLRLLFGRVAA